MNHDRPNTPISTGAYRALLLALWLVVGTGSMVFIAPDALAQGGGSEGAENGGSAGDAGGGGESEGSGGDGASGSSSSEVPAGSSSNSTDSSNSSDASSDTSADSSTDGSSDTADAADGSDTESADGADADSGDASADGDGSGDASGGDAGADAGSGDAEAGESEAGDGSGESEGESGESAEGESESASGESEAESENGGDAGNGGAESGESESEHGGDVSAELAESGRDQPSVRDAVSDAIELSQALVFERLRFVGVDPDSIGLNEFRSVRLENFDPNQPETGFIVNCPCSTNDEGGFCSTYGTVNQCAYRATDADIDNEYAKRLMLPTNTVITQMHELLILRGMPTPANVELSAANFSAAETRQILISSLSTLILTQPSGYGTGSKLKSH